MDEIVNWCFDIIDERNYLYSEICWNTELPNNFIIDKSSDYQNQGLEEITSYMCVAYSTTHWVNILNNIENLWEWDYNAKEFGLKMVELWRLDTTKWAVILDWPKTAREVWNIDSYFQVKTIDEVKQAIVNWHPVVTWSNQLAWDKVCYEKPSYWHCILIIGYNETGFIIKNSYWKWEYDNWTNLLPYSLFDKLFYTKLALVDKPNTILQYKQQIMANITIEEAKKAFEQWIWNWLNPKWNANREEVATMIYRAIEKLKKDNNLK